MVVTCPRRLTRSTLRWTTPLPQAEKRVIKINLSFYPLYAKGEERLAHPETSGRGESTRLTRFALSA